uniref:Transcription and mRNA export factor ENY2 n=1 Tax=Arundo donax TaxID=35708 RepID=A0A0A8Y3N0_ARUDO
MTSVGREGEKEKLMELLRELLVEGGWRDEMKALCRFGFSHIKPEFQYC